jgi:hypothetical protein
MLSAFQLDEFTQFRALWRMTEPSDTLGEAIHRIAAYDYYYYGFPFFGLSVPVFMPLRNAYLETGTPGLTAAGMLALRQMSPFFASLAIAILVALWTRLRSTPRMVALFIFLAALPSVVLNNLWWHPDALLLLGVVSTIAALTLDGKRLGRWFYVAAFACGFVIATKLVGLWFFAAIAVHLFRARKQHSLHKLALAGAGFLATMVFAILAGSPHFFLPSEWEATARGFRFTAFHISTGWGEKATPGVAPWIPLVRSGFGWLTTFAALLVLCVVTALRAPRSEDRGLAVTILAWLIPASFFIVTEIAIHRERYLLPFLLPLASCAGSPVLWNALRGPERAPLQRIAAIAIVVLLGAQLGSNLQRDLRRYDAALHRVENSPSLAFWSRFESEVISRLPPDTHLRIFRDVYVYVPPQRRFEVHVRWRPTGYSEIAETRPNLILLRQAEIERYADPESVDRSLDPEQALRAHAFHRDALEDSIPGYRRIFATDYAVAYSRVDSTEISALQPYLSPLID